MNVNGDRIVFKVSRKESAMNVALIGYGKMGREIEKILLQQGENIALLIDKNNSADLNPDNLREKNIDVAIEFSTPETAYENIETCIRAGIPVVSGTTGWSDKLERVRSLCKENGGAFFYASNFSIGVNVMFKVNEVLAKMMDSFPQYDVTVEEVHHTQKKDAPSGTAITIAEAIVRHFSPKKKWVGETTTEPDELEVLAVRRSIVPGVHTVTYESEDDIIELRHSAKSRRGFAMGAVLAARFIVGKKGVFSMDDLLGL